MNSNFKFQISNSEGGFSLIEMVVVMFIMGMLLFMGVHLLFNLTQFSQAGYGYMDKVDRVKIVTSTFVNELRNSTIGNDGSYQIVRADNNEMIFYSAYGASARNCQVSNCALRIRYQLSGGTLYKGTTLPELNATGTGYIYDLNNEILEEFIETSAEPLFSYYNGCYYDSGEADETGQPLAQPIPSMNRVKFAKINLTVEKKIQNTVSNFSVSIGGAIRTVKNNIAEHVCY